MIGLAPEYGSIKFRSMYQGRRKQYCLRHHITSTIHAAMGGTFESMASEISISDPNFGLWDKGMLIVLISRTKLPHRTIFVGSKQETLNTLKRVLLRKTQWTDYIENILDIITVNTVPTTGRVITPENFPFRVKDMQLPQCNSGIVYMLLSLKCKSFCYIGKTRNPRSRLNNHNCGYGSSSTEPIHLRPFAVMAYICGFEGCDTMMLSIERKWKEVRDNLIVQGMNDPREWARSGRSVIECANNQRSDGNGYDLRLVLLFNDE